MKSLMLAAALALGLSGCALFEGDTAEHDVFGVGVAYAAVGTAALEYTTLPRCDAAPAPCSEQAVVDRIKEADNVAYNALKAAQSAVQADSASLAAEMAAADAFAAVLAMEQLLIGFGVLDGPVAEAAAEEAS